MKKFAFGVVVGGLIGTGFGAGFVCHKLLQNQITRTALKDAMDEAIHRALFGEPRMRVVHDQNGEHRPRTTYGRGEHRA